MIKAEINSYVAGLIDSMNRDRGILSRLADDVMSVAKIHGNKTQRRNIERDVLLSKLSEIRALIKSARTEMYGSVSGEMKPENLIKEIK